MEAKVALFFAFVLWGLAASLVSAQQQPPTKANALTPPACPASGVKGTFTQPANETFFRYAINDLTPWCLGFPVLNLSMLHSFSVYFDLNGPKGEATATVLDITRGGVVVATERRTFAHLNVSRPSVFSFEEGGKEGLALYPDRIYLLALCIDPGYDYINVGIGTVPETKGYRGPPPHMFMCDMPQCYQGLFGLAFGAMATEMVYSC
jgi:hypothetical protein